MTDNDPRNYDQADDLADKPDPDLEPANVADGLFAIARAIDRLSDALVRTGRL